MSIVCNDGLQTIKQKPGDAKGIVKASSDLAMAYIGTVGPIGLGISVIYFVGSESGAFDS